MNKKHKSRRTYIPTKSTKEMIKIYRMDDSNDAIRIYTLQYVNYIARGKLTSQALKVTYDKIKDVGGNTLSQRKNGDYV